MPQFTIEKNVPVPDGCGRGPKPKYPFGVMEVGDSFAIPLSGKIKRIGKPGQTDQAASNVRAGASLFAKRHGGRFTVRVLKSEGVCRVWRVA